VIPLGYWLKARPPHHTGGGLVCQLFLTGALDTGATAECVGSLDISFTALLMRLIEFCILILLGFWLGDAPCRCANYTDAGIKSNTPKQLFFALGYLFLIVELNQRFKQVFFKKLYHRQNYRTHVYLGLVRGRACLPGLALALAGMAPGGYRLRSACFRAFAWNQQ
jgi:hypothetical protein